MASAKQIAWRKKFARMSKAGKFKKSKTKISRKAQLGMGMRAYQNAEKSSTKSNPHNKSSFTIEDYLDNEAINHHAENSLQLTKKYGTKSDIRKMEAINKRHKERGSLTYADLLIREKLTLPFYNKLIKGTSRKQLTRESHPELYD